jgi:hypothetical protein
MRIFEIFDIRIYLNININIRNRDKVDIFKSNFYYYFLSNSISTIRIRFQ